MTTRKYKYPIARKDNIIGDYHGVKIPDPYRWLEDPASPETEEWVEAQNKITRDFLDSYPGKQKIGNRLKELFNFPRSYLPEKKGNRYFYLHNDGLQNHAILYMKYTLQDSPVPVIDPNKFSQDGTIAMTSYFVSQDGKHVAYQKSVDGSDWTECYIREVDSGKDCTETLKWCRFSMIAWKHDNTGFFYTRFPEPGTVDKEDETRCMKVCWHTIRTPQEQDKLVYQSPEEKELLFHPVVTNDGEFLVLYITVGTDTRNKVYYLKLNGEEKFTRLLDDFDAKYIFIDNIGTTFYFHTDYNAPRGRVIAIDINNPGRDNWNEIIPQSTDTISTVKMVDNKLVVSYLHHAYHRVKIFSLKGEFIKEIKLPVMGCVEGISGTRNDTELFIWFHSFITPPTIFRYDFKVDKLDIFFKPVIHFDSNNYEINQVFYRSKDGTEIPMFLVHNKGLNLNGNNPVELYGYGGFAITMGPNFSISRLVWLENNGVYAQPCLRGGDEYGEKWHRAGMLEKKQNVFDDFIAAAEYLVEKKYTNNNLLAIRGGSNGGLLTGASMVQRPDLFGAVISSVPVLDMLRYHKWSIGHYWIPEYGNAEENPEHFRFLVKYSPLHNVKEGTCYPPVLIISADTDDRVVPAHAKKFAATLQPANSGDNPVLLKIETKTGHGVGKPVSKMIKETTDMLTFLFKVFNMKI